MAEDQDLMRVKVLISGTVQGVCFRERTEDQAHRKEDQASGKELRGWVENLSDGRVETVFGGPTTLVQEMVGWCLKGPPSANVKHLAVFVEDAATISELPHPFKAR